MISRLSTFLAELKRRKVYRVAGLYAGTSAAVALAAAELYDDLLLPDWTPRLILVLLVLGFPIALVLAWAYELRPEEPPPSGTWTPARVPSAAESPRRSIVVLPFDNMSPDPADEYVADGLTEEITTLLSRIHSLRVISRNSAMVLKGTSKSTPAIARELNVQYVLEGSVRKAGTDLRITAQLIQAEEDEHLWVETYDGTMEEIFRIQERTARSIVAALRLSLTPVEDLRLRETPIDNARAYELYLMARRDLWAGTPDGIARARRHLEDGIEIVGENVVLLQGLAEVHLHANEYGVSLGEDSLRAAEKLASRIVALEPNAASAPYLLGRIERFRGSTTGAIARFEQALAIDPHHASSLLFLFHSCTVQAGRPDVAAPLREAVLAQDPLDLLTWFTVALHHWMNGDLEGARAAMKKAGELVGGSDFADMVLAYILIWMDRRTEALALVRDVVRRDTPDLFSEWGLFLQRTLEGAGASASEALSEGTRHYLWNDPEFVWLGVSTFALAGDRDEALTWLEHAVDRGWINYPLFSRQDPLLESVRGEARFEELMVTLKRDWDAFGALNHSAWRSR